MGKGQQLRRQQEQASSSLLAAPMPRSGIGIPTGLPPTPPPGGGLKATAPVFNYKPKVQSNLESAQGMKTFMTSDGHGRLSAVDQLLSSSANGQGRNSPALQSSKSMQNLSEALASVDLSSATTKIGKMKGSSSFEDLGNLAGARPDNSDQSSIAADLSAIVKRCGIKSPEGYRILRTMSDNVQLNCASSEGALLLLQSLLKQLGRSIEPFALPLLPRILTLNADRNPAVRDLAFAVGNDLAEIVCPHAFRIIYLQILTRALVPDADWRVKVAALSVLKVLAPRCSSQLSPLLPHLIPLVSESAMDPKKQVQVAGLDALNVACKGISNEDITPIVPQLVSVIAHPDESAKTVDSLLETTFVSNVDSATLALIAPLLSKALRGRSTVLKRKASRIIDNMSRLVQNPSDVAPFVPLLLPQLNRVIDEIADEEVCEVATAARTVLLKSMGEGNVPTQSSSSSSSSSSSAAAASISRPASSSPAPLEFQVPAAASPDLEPAVLHHHLLRALVAMGPSKEADYDDTYPLCDIIFEHIAQLLAHLLAFSTPSHADAASCTPANAWNHAVAMSSTEEFKDCYVPYMKCIVATGGLILSSGSDAATAATSEQPGTPMEVPLLSDGSVDEATYDDNLTEEADKACVQFRLACLGGIEDVEAREEIDEANVCNIEFSLAFGGKILLHNARLKLARGRRYGLMGKNGAGKTTLMTNIGTHNIDGFPPELRSVYVQHDDSAMEDLGLSLIDELAQNKELVEVGVTKEEAANALLEINFTQEMLDNSRTALSGGWKMKLLIVRAMLLKADILLLDEPTNHLDAASVKWLADYLAALHNVTCLIVSHDTGFLDATVTDIIHYEKRKLVYYHGSLQDFVKLHPEAKYYYALESSNLKFTFPTPERLEGINSTSRTILKMDHVSYTYPGSTKPTIKDASVRLCLASRVAVLGPNGAGKSTLIKMIVQETQPDGFDADDIANNAASDNTQRGEYWKHHNLRVAYVAQHSFHHIEQHLDLSPVDYIKWRFDGGVDHEAVNKSTMKLSEEEEAGATTKKYGDVKEIVGRRKNGHTLEYECSWIGQSFQEQTYVMKKRGIAPQMEPNKYISLDEMIALGHAKIVQQADAKIAARAAGLDLRPLITREIQGHLDEFNLEAEFGTHGSIRRLSGGQKVKLVLAAAMWNRPHLIVLDEPTNYLDREALGALTDAIRNFNGGVLIISHNADFTNALCTEKWLVNNGVVEVQGQVEEVALKSTSNRKNKEAALEKEKKLDVSGAKSGNTNKTKEEVEKVKNPRSFEYLSRKEVRVFSKLAAVAGMTLKDYVGRITKDSPEWKLLSANVNC